MVNMRSKTMQITFSREEFVDMLSGLWGIPLGVDDLVLDFDEMTGDVKTFTVKGMTSASLARVGAVTQSAAPTPQRVENRKSSSVFPSSVKEDEPRESADDINLDDVIRLSHELALQGQPRSDKSPDNNQNELLMYPGASDTFPLDFANQVLGK
jgi:hypothetical protein